MEEAAKYYANIVLPHGGQAVREIENVMGELNWELPQRSLNFKWIPGEKEFELTKVKGIELAKAIRES